MAVVDDELKMHGLDGLRVIDAAVVPAITSTNLRANDHDRRKGCCDHQRRGAATTDGITKVTGRLQAVVAVPVAC